MKLTYGFNCKDVGCKVDENYVEYLNCPTVDFAPCDTINCDSIPETILCTMVGVTLLVSGVTPTSATVSFTPPAFDYTVYLSTGTTIVNTQDNPSSPITYTGLTPDTDYVAHLINHCPHGEDREISQGFHTPPACVDITGIEATGEDIPE